MFYDDNSTNEKLGEKLGFGTSTVSLWRTGKRTPNLTNLIRLADYFNCSLDFLLGRSDDDSKITAQPLFPFHERLSHILNERELSWYKVVKDTRIAKSNMQDWRKGCSPLLPMLIELADYLDVTIDYLVGRER